MLIETLSLVMMFYIRWCVLVWTNPWHWFSCLLCLESMCMDLCNVGQALLFLNTVQISDRLPRSFEGLSDRDTRQSNNICRVPMFSYIHNTLPKNACTFHKMEYFIRLDLKREALCVSAFHSISLFNPLVALWNSIT